MLPLWVRTRPLYTPVAMVWADTIDLAMGIVILVYQSSGVINYVSILTRFGVPYFSILISLNVLITLMIVIRLVLHCRDIRATLGVPGGFSGLYKTIITMLVESCALITVSLLLVIGLLGAANPVMNTFMTMLAETQVRALLNGA